MTENRNTPFDPEELQYEPNRGGAQEVRDLINNGKYQQAESLLNSTNLDESEREALSRELNDSLRKLSPELPRTGDISFEQAESATRSAEDREYEGYLRKHRPGMEELAEMNGIVVENEEILDELSRTINEARKEASANMWAKPVGFVALPVIADIYAILKGKRLKKTLNRLEKLNAKLKNPKLLDDSLNADKISPSKGHLATIIGMPTFAVGYGVGAAGAIAAAPVTAGIGFGVAIAGGVTALIGYVKQVISWGNIDATKDSLKELEDKINRARANNDASKMQIAMYQNAAVQGARENTEELMARAA
ncbi:hypothetical protein C0416_05430 [bacterium]|nr:hypothetical protein [bacterium]